MFKKTFIILTITMLSSLLMACQKTTTPDPKTDIDITVEQTSIFIQPFEFGPAVSKIILELDTEVNEVKWTDHTTVKTANINRDISDVYLSDGRGEPLKNDSISKYVSLDLIVDYDTIDTTQNPSPFTFNLEAFRNNWSETFQIEIEGLDVETKDSIANLKVNEDAIHNRVSPETDKYTNRGEKTGRYTNPYTNTEEEITLQYASYEPEDIEDGEKNALIIWLHGGGEGGTDIDIALLGNEVTGLSQKPIQDYFKSTGSGKQIGVYVLAVQTPTLWMDDGSGQFSPSAKSSRYTEALMDTIKAYVDSNEDIDPNRIYLSGCSNGGYMTVELGLRYPNYFAALVPIATPYPYYNSYQMTPEMLYMKSDTADDEPIWFDDSKVKTLSDTPIWFIHAEADTTISATDYALPVYKALVDNGSKNKWFSYYESVQGKDIKNTTYNGHWSWIYYFNDHVSGVQEIDRITGSEGLEGFIPNDINFGGPDKVTVDNKTYTSVFEWLNDQSNE